MVECLHCGEQDYSFDGVLENFVCSGCGYSYDEAYEELYGTEPPLGCKVCGSYDNYPECRDGCAAYDD